MAFGRFSQHNRSAPMAEINMTPLIDVMLVLLVIFIITAPLMTQALKLNLPSAAAKAAAQTPQTVTVSIDRDGKLYWQGENLDMAALQQRFAELAKQKGVTEPEIHLRADEGTRYRMIAQIMSAAQQAGLTKIGFVTQPNPTQ